MPRLIALSAGLLSLSVLAVDASAQSAPPGHTPDTPSDSDATALAKKLQNPIGDLYSFPFQNNTNLNTGPNKGTQDILNVQPVIPIHISEDWNVITRTILPPTTDTVIASIPPLSPLHPTIRHLGDFGAWTTQNPVMAQGGDGKSSRSGNHRGRPGPNGADLANTP